MSLPLDPVVVNELTAVYDSLFINTCCTIAAAAFFIYESVVTFDVEVEHFWKFRLTGPSILYILNKYLSLMVQVTTLAISLPMLTDTYLPWAAFSALRVYALSGRKWLWPILVFALSIVPLAINLTQFWVNRLSGFIDPLYGCVETGIIGPAEIKYYCNTYQQSPLADGRALSDVTISRTCLIVADVILISITISSVSRKNILSQILKPQSLQCVLLRDGAIYFIVLLILNAVHLILSLQSTFLDGVGSTVVVFTEPCTAVLVSRFLLHLQESATRTLRVGSDHPLHLSMDSARGVPSFVRFVGSIGYRASQEGEPRPEIESGRMDETASSYATANNADLEHRSHIGSA
ncbi:hypothetical protein C8Q76DRAFT_792859 [Earliella scabrosa]|nr:hypothetical protein C8Q76DRAFT_792859 [Earliella scabrosa]